LEIELGIFAANRFHPIALITYWFNLWYTWMYAPRYVLSRTDIFSSL